MRTLIGIDRDGTLLKDEDYYLGSSPEWKNQIEFLSGVVEGLRILQDEYVDLALITNQAGIAQGRFSEGRAVEVNNYLIGLLREKGIVFNCSFICPYVDRKYALKKRSKGENVLEEYVFDDHPDSKPNIGMLEKAARFFGRSLKDYRIHYIGDRMTDVKTGLNANGIGHLIPSWKTKNIGDEDEATRLINEYPNRIFIHPDFLTASKAIKRILDANLS